MEGTFDQWAAEILVRKSRLFSTPYALFTQGLSQQTVSPVMVHGADYSVYSGQSFLCVFCAETLLVRRAASGAKI